MSSRRSLSLAVLGLFAALVPVRAADDPSRSPTLIVRVRSIESVIDDVKYLSSRAGRGNVLEMLQTDRGEHLAADRRRQLVDLRGPEVGVAYDGAQWPLPRRHGDQTENGLDDADQQFYENYVCGAERSVIMAATAIRSSTS